MPSPLDPLTPAAGPVTRPHFAWPFQIADSGQIAMVDQNSDAEIGMAMAITLSWPLGTRDLDPEFGIDEELFLSGGPSADEIRAALQHGEPRAIARIVNDDSALTNFAAAVRVAWSDAKQDPDQ
jgi:hypothetical protein